MSFPAKVDGFGTRLDTSTGKFDKVNSGAAKGKFVRLFASEPIEKGMAVVFDFRDTEPVNKYGTTVMKCDNNASHDDGLRKQCVIGVAAEATTDVSSAAASAAAPVLIEIQVAGLCDYAQITAKSGLESGDPLNASDTPGELKLVAEDETLYAAIHCKDGTDGAADSTIFLLNPANL